jgi:hypothetical protein
VENELRDGFARDASKQTVCHTASSHGMAMFQDLKYELETIDWPKIGQHVQS